MPLNATKMPYNATKMPLNASKMPYKKLLQFFQSNWYFLINLTLRADHFKMGNIPLCKCSVVVIYLSSLVFVFLCCPGALWKKWATNASRPRKKRALILQELTSQFEDHGKMAPHNKGAHMICTPAESGLITSCHLSWQLHDCRWSL